MSLFALFNLLSFITGIALWKYDTKVRVGAVALICLGISIGYYYLNKI